jgi:hypothetical protein
MTKDKALKMALEALEEAHYKIEHKQDAAKREQAITAIKEALANEALDKMAENARELGLDYEPPQEPMKWAKFSAKGNIIDLLNEPDDNYTPLYTAPPQRTWVGLTEDEADKIYKDGNTFGEMMRMVEAKLKEKNS